MNKKNFLQTAAEFFGFSAERVEVMSEEEKQKLEGFGEQIEAAEGQVDALTEQINSATAKITELNESIQAKDSQIAELELAIEAKDAAIEASKQELAAAQAEIENLQAQLANLPGAEITQTASEQDPEIATQQQEPQATESEITLQAKALINRK